MSFVKACENNDIELAKTLPIPNKNILNDLFIKICMVGYFDMAKLLHSLGADIQFRDNTAFILACNNGNLEMAQWLHGLGADIFAKDNRAFIWACGGGHLNVAKWLHSLGVHISTNRALEDVCRSGHLNFAQWLIDIHYKYCGYIEFYGFSQFSDEIKNLLIDNNLIDPSTLSKRALKYYLTRTNNVVPPDFTTRHEGFEVKYRGKHTKPAPRE